MQRVPVACRALSRLEGDRQCANHVDRHAVDSSAAQIATWSERRPDARFARRLASRTAPTPRTMASLSSSRTTWYSRHPCEAKRAQEYRRQVPCMTAPSLSAYGIPNAASKNSGRSERVTNSTCAFGTSTDRPLDSAPHIDEGDDGVVRPVPRRERPGSPIRELVHILARLADSRCSSIGTASLWRCGGWSGPAVLLNKKREGPITMTQMITLSGPRW